MPLQRYTAAHPLAGEAPDRRSIGLQRAKNRRKRHDRVPGTFQQRGSAAGGHQNGIALTGLSVCRGDRSVGFYKGTEL